MHHRAQFVPLALLALALTACSPGRLFSFGSGVELVDGGPGFDAGPGMDSGPAMDGGPGFDAGPPFDGGAGFDSGPAMDAGMDAGNDAGPPPAGELAPVTIVDVDGFQTIGIPMVRGGSAAGGSTAPIAADRELFVRVTVTPDGGFSGMVEGRMTLTRGAEQTVLVDSRNVSGAIGALPAEGFSFEVPPEWVSPDVEYVITMHTTMGGGTLGARYPQTNAANLGAVDLPAIEIHLVPFRYNADGSGRLPNIDSASIAALRAHFESLLPTGEVRIEVLEPIDYGSSISPLSGGSWSNALRAVQSARSANSPAAHVYYIGLVNPADTARGYCGSGCIAGIGSVNNSNQPSQRSSIAIGYARENDFFSAFHELGHTMGFPHAPCGGASGSDPSFPHPGGTTGVWGRDERSGALLPPNSSDYMGYCRDKWMSDYHYDRIATRIQAHGDGGSSAIVSAVQHVRITTGPFVAPEIDRDVFETPATIETGGLLLPALNDAGEVDGEVWVHEQELSIAGFTQWLVPEGEGIAGVVLPSGQHVHF